MHIISIANQKGGCGKTTTSINLASALALNGQKVLLIDLDPQSHASLGLNVESQSSMYNVISKLTPRKLNIRDIIVRIEDTFDLAPSNVLVGTLEQELADEIGRELKLKEVIATIQGAYDIVLIDCPPSLGFLTVNALRASDEVLIPVETSRFSLQGVDRLMDIVNLIKERLGHAVVPRILITMFDSRLRHSFSMLSKIKEQFSTMLLNTIIHVNVKLKESAVMGKTVSQYDKYSRGFKDYFSLACELISVWDKGNGVFRSRIEPHLERAPKRKLAAPPRIKDEAEASPEVSAEIPVSRIAEDSAASEPEAQITEQAEKVTEPGDVYTVFSLEAPEAQSVYVTGTFNDWSLDESCRLEQDRGVWTIKLFLEPGVYQYRFIIDGTWREDPRNPLQEKNPFGDVNSLVEVKG